MGYNPNIQQAPEQKNLLQKFAAFSSKQLENTEIPLFRYGSVK